MNKNANNLYKIAFQFIEIGSNLYKSMNLKRVMTLLNKY